MIYLIYDVLQVIVSQDWENFRSTILSRPALFRDLSNAASTCPQLNGMTLLHAAVRYTAPIDIISEIIRLCPDMPAATDCLGRTPLHVAAGTRSSTMLLNLLAHSCPTACMIQDDGGKTPLHFACDGTCVLFEGDCLDEPPSYEAVEALLSYSIYAATIEDEDEMSPLEHAILSGASMTTVKLLQNATSKGMQLSHLQSFIAATPSLHPQDDSSNAINSKIPSFSESRRVSADQEDLKYD